jgi:hypothetical protein
MPGLSSTLSRRDNPDALHGEARNRTEVRRDSVESLSSPMDRARFELAVLPCTLALRERRRLGDPELPGRV